MRRWNNAIHVIHDSRLDKEYYALNKIKNISTINTCGLIFYIDATVFTYNSDNLEGESMYYVSSDSIDY